MSIEENKELARRFIDQVLNEHNITAIPEFMISGSMFAGAFEGFVTNYIQAGFPDFHLTIEGVFGEGDKVLIQTTISTLSMSCDFGQCPRRSRRIEPPQSHSALRRKCL